MSKKALQISDSGNLQPKEAKLKKVVSSPDELTTFAERLQIILGNESARSFALRADILPATFHNYIKGTSEPKRPEIVAIAEAAQVNMDWLTTGRGPRYKSENKSLDLTIMPEKFNITNLEGRQIQFTPDPGLCHLPVLSLEGACGNGVMIDNEFVTAVFSATKQWFRRELGRNPEQLCLVKARGDSMADTIMPEELVFVDHSCSSEPVDGVWVFRHQEGLYIKRLQFLPNSKIAVNSDNPRYQAFTIEAQSDFRLLGQVIAALPFRKL